jgi:gliding motility-associated-like protein
MKKIIFLALAGLLNIKSNAQCFDIQSILVDACAGSLEGQNEMVTFKVGTVALNTANLTVNWPNNSWLGVTQNAGTAADVATVNATILGCGFLKEPTAGVLPANAKVLLVTSTSWNPLAQSFVNLSDTFYIIFQTAGNTAGHFANYASGGGLRTLSMAFSFPVGCNDAVTYDRALLLTQSLTIGAQDGGAVDFNPAGTPTYVNRGCQAPYIPITVDAGLNKTICFNSSQSFTATTNSNYTSVLWSLGATASGTFSSTNTLTTTYTPSLSDNGTIKLYFTLFKTCGTQTISVKDSVNLTILKLPLPAISASSNTICSGQSSTLSYSLSNSSSTGTTSVLWLPSNATSNSISVNATNIYSVQVTNACGNNTSTISITSVPLPSVSISASGATQFCAGGSVVLTATSSVGNYLWTGGATTNTLSINTQTTVVVTTTNACGSAQATQTVNVIPVPTVTASPSVIGICSGQSATALANTNTPVTYTWTGGINTNTISLNAAGVYTVSVSNSCGSAAATVTVTSGSSPSITAAASPSFICAGQTSILSLSGSIGTTLWSNGATTSTTSISTPGVYTATVSNSCGNAVTSITVNQIVTPIVAITPTNVTICGGQSVVLTANSNVNSYFWNTGAITNTISVNTAGIKTVSVSNVCGTAVATVNVGSGSAPVLNLMSSSSTICPNQTATLTVFGGTAPYTWSNSSATGSVVTTNGGMVSVSNTNNCGTSTSTINVSVVSINASISANPISGVKPLVVNFTNNSLGANSYLWDFGNGNSAITQTVSAQTYTAAGLYTVYLSVYNNPCYDIDSLVIRVLNEEPDLVVPNVFTPNNDSINDVFKVTGFNITTFNCVIFNRWGLQLYTWGDITKGWDGKFNGNTSTDGTYFYIIQATDINDKEIKKQGTFSLFK